ncbi:hypothetical protein CRUP_000484 [Coryphaenoides rupestris]|nr:hypothetical protein CRUP_000484 [Coryphaenoides rupestris]
MSPKAPAPGAQFLPGFLLGDLPAAPASPQPRSFSLAAQGLEPRTPLLGVLSPAQVDPFYSQGEALSSEDQLDQTWVTVFG